MAFPPINALSANVPNRNDDPADFSDDVDNFLSELPTWQSQLNAFGSYLDDTGEIIEQDKNDAAASALTASNAASSAVGAANFKGLWSSLSGALNKPATVSHNGGFWLLLNNLANVALSEPGVSADWVFQGGTGWRPVQTSSGALPTNSNTPAEATSSDLDFSIGPFNPGDYVAFHNSSQSTNQVRILNSAYTIRGAGGIAVPGYNIVVSAGDTVHLLAQTSLILEIV